MCIVCSWHYDVPALHHLHVAQQLGDVNVAGEGGQRLVTVEENNSVPRLQEMFCRGRAPRARAEVVHEPHRVHLQRDGGAARGYETYRFQTAATLTDSFIVKSHELFYPVFSCGKIGGRGISGEETLPILTWLTTSHICKI